LAFAHFKEPSMKLPIVVPLTLLVASAILGCSSSGSSASPGGSDDAATPEDATTPFDSSLPNTGNPDSSDVQDSSTPDDSSPATNDAGPLSFSADIYGPIVQHHCIGCHGPTADGGPGSGIAFGHLDMSSVDAGFANLVNVAAAGGACELIDGSAGPVRVVPGNAAASLLYDKVNGFTVAPVCGSPMPKSGEIGDGGQAAVVGAIQTWINQGALP
jgi:hypothetical protein